MANGQEDAFRQLVQHYQRMVYSIALSVVKDNFIAEEVAQDAFLKAYQHIRSFDHRSAFSTWLYRIVTNEALMRLRKMGQDKLSFTDALPEEDVAMPDLTGLDATETAQLIQEGLKALPYKESLVLRLYYLEETNMQAVSEITGWTTSNIKVLLHRGRKRMAQLLHSKIQQLYHG